MIKRILTKIARILNQNRIPYMVIGGQAVLLYGVPRLTEDIDITLGVGLDKAPKIKSLFKKMNLFLPKNIDDNFVKKTFCLVGIEKHTGIRIDFIFSFTSYEREAIKKAKAVKIDGTKVKFASVEDLIIHKLFAKRERDLEDIKIIIGKYWGKTNIKYIKNKLKDFVSLNGYEDIVKRFNSLVRKISKKE